MNAVKSGISSKRVSGACSKAQSLNTALSEAESGVSLIEMLIVLAILSLAASLALPKLSGRDQTTPVSHLSSDIAVKLRAARAKAVAENREIVFAFDMEDRNYRVEGIGEPRQLPAGISLTITTARNRSGGREEARIAFFPDGTSSGGTIRMAYQGYSVAIEVAWLTGAITTDWSAP